MARSLAVLNRSRPDRFQGGQRLDQVAPGIRRNPPPLEWRFAWNGFGRDSARFAFAAANVGRRLVRMAMM